MYRYSGLLALVLAAPAAAQVVPPQLPSQSDISRERVPQFLPQTPDYDLRIETPERSAVPRSVDELEFAVKAIAVDGASHYPEAEVDALFAPLVGRTVVLEDLRVAASRLEARYRADGFFLTRVFVPAQQVKDGVLRVQVVEGYIDSVLVNAQDDAARRRIEKMLKPLIGKRPVKLSDVEGKLLTINDMPGLSASSVLHPSDTLGATELVMTADQRPHAVRASAHNAGSEQLGEWTFGVGTTLNRPLGRTGALDLALSAGGRGLREVRSGSIRYSEPVGTGGLVASIGALAGIAKPGGSIRNLDVDSRVTSFSARLRYPLVRSRSNSLFLDGGIALNRTRTDMLGTRIVHDRQTVAEATLIWQQNGFLNGGTNIIVSAFQGLGIFGAMDAGAPLGSVAGFDPDFTRVAGSVQRVQKLPAGFSAYGVLQGQYTDDTLLSGELITFGGPALGRGYDPSQIAGDRGIGALLELRYDLPIGGGTVSDVQLYGFADAARAKTLENGTRPGHVEKLSSLGVGVRFKLRQILGVDVQFADARREIPGGVDRDPRVLVHVTFNR